MECFRSIISGIVKDDDRDGRMRGCGVEVRGSNDVAQFGLIWRCRCGGGDEAQIAKVKDMKPRYGRICALAHPIQFGLSIDLTAQSEGRLGGVKKAMRKGRDFGRRRTGTTRRTTSVVSLSRMFKAGRDVGCWEGEDNLVLLYPCTP